jgi:uncharacterized membrane-anchored protein
MMALLALPMARVIAPEITRCEGEFPELTASMASPEQRVTRASGLLRTRVGITVEEQNRVC